MDEKSSIKEYFKGKNIFITGGSGFVGKVLIEKLLRSCPDIGNIYLLIRPKKGKSIAERVDQIVSTPLFEELRRTNSGNIKKIIPINGDAAELGLGISEDDERLLIEEVHIFYHAAASVRFDDFLKLAIFMNVRSAREAAALALRMKKIEVFLHVSTAYCNIDNKTVIEEILYPPHGDWREAITVAETCDTQLLNILSPKYIGTFPNTYTFTKLLGEHCINDMLVGKVPTVICRPSIVISTIAEPFQGWIDNFNGPVGLLVAGGSGLLRTVYGSPKLDADYVAVDGVIKFMIVASWHKANFGDKNSLSVYQATKYKQLKVTLDVTVELGKKLYWDVPFEKKIWFPGNSMTGCWYNYFFNVILFHMIPAVFLDLMLKITGHKPMFLKIQRKIYIANTAVSPFMFTEWLFVNEKAMQLYDIIPRKEVEEFNFKITPAGQQEMYEYYLMSCNLARQYLLKEGKTIKDETRARTWRMYLLDRGVKVIFLTAMVWTIFFKINILNIFFKMFCNYWNSL